MLSFPNAAEPCLAEAIRRIRAPGFEGALDAWLRRCIAIDNLLVLAVPGSGPPLALYRKSDRPLFFADLEATYLAGAYLLDPTFELNRRRAPPGVYRLRDIAPDGFRRSRYYRDYYRGTSLVDELVFVAYPAPGFALNLYVGRDAASGLPFDGRDLETVARVAPIVTALVEAHWADLAPAGPVRAFGPAVDLRGALARTRGLRISPRQAEVALLILRGHSSASIGLRLGVTRQTVKVFRRQLYARCELSSQAQLFALMLPLLGDQANASGDA